MTDKPHPPQGVIEAHTVTAEAAKRAGVDLADRVLADPDVAAVVADDKGDLYAVRVQPQREGGAPAVTDPKGPLNVTAATIAPLRRRVSELQSAVASRPRDLEVSITRDTVDGVELTDVTIQWTLGGDRQAFVFTGLTATQMQAFTAKAAPDPLLGA